MEGFKSLRIRILLLLILVGITAFFAMPDTGTKACQQCVTLTGGLCVGCQGGLSTGYRDCNPDQSSCSCTTGGAGQCNKDSEDGEGGPVG